MVKIPLGSDYTYNYKRIGKIAYGIRSSQTIIPDYLRDSTLVSNLEISSFILVTKGSMFNLICF